MFLVQAPHFFENALEGVQMRPDEVGAELTKVLVKGAQEKKTFDVTFSVSVNDGGVRRVKVLTEKVLK